jgi:hypothetical protein
MISEGLFVIFLNCCVYILSVGNLQNKVLYKHLTLIGVVRKFIKADMNFKAQRCDQKFEKDREQSQNFV